MANEEERREKRGDMERGRESREVQMKGGRRREKREERERQWGDMEVGGREDGHGEGKEGGKGRRDRT